MRLTIEKILKQGYKPTTQHTLCSGFIDGSHVSVIIPRSEEAKMNSMIEGGLDLDDEKNYDFYNKTMDTIGSVEGKPFASQISGQKIIRIGRSFYDPKTIRNFTKHYKRKNDRINILGNTREGAIMRMLSPCGDWWFIIAPRVYADNTLPTDAPYFVIGLDPFDIEALL